jgi:ADP-ribosylglycohydrolase
MAAMVRMLVDGMDLLAAADEAVALLSNDPEADDTISAIRAATEMWRERPTDHASAVARLGEGWIGEEALAVGIYAALAGQTFREVFAIAANHDGDSDCTASIARHAVPVHMKTLGWNPSSLPHVVNKGSN